MSEETSHSDKRINPQVRHNDAKCTHQTSEPQNVRAKTDRGERRNLPL